MRVEYVCRIIFVCRVSNAAQSFFYGNNVARDFFTPLITLVILPIQGRPPFPAYVHVTLCRHSHGGLTCTTQGLERGGSVQAPFFFFFKKSFDNLKKRVSSQ